MPRYPFYDNDFAGDIEDLSYYGGRHNFYFPRVGPFPNRRKRWNKYAFPDHLYGPSDPEADSYQVTEATEEMSEEEAASLSDGDGYPKLQPSPVWPLEAADRLLPVNSGYTYTWEDVGALNQYGGLPREFVAEGDGDINPGLRAMLSLFQGRLKLASNTPRSYWFMWYEVPTTAPGGDELLQYWGQADAWAYRWELPGFVEGFDPDVITGTLAGEEPYTNWKATTPYYYSGNMLAPNWLNEPESTVGVLPLTYINGDEDEITNRFRRLKNSRFWLVAHPSDVPPIEGDPDNDLLAHNNWITQVGRIHLLDYELKDQRDRTTETRRWIKKWG